jgi:VIT1/CCC1 family predicted Fe2+/Mn2+ transporter
MPQSPHIERHFTGGEAIRDVAIGMADGLTVPFALAAGLSGAVNSTGIILTAGLAEIAAGSIAMGLGGYLAGRSEVQHYASEEEREHREVVEKPEEELAEVEEIFRGYGLSNEEMKPLLTRLSEQPQVWVDFMMRFELGLEKPDPKRALFSALTIAAAYIVGGLIPLSPYMVIPEISTALFWSAVMTLASMAGFGFLKGHFTGQSPWRSGLHTMLIGGLAASAAFAIARAIA